MAEDKGSSLFDDCAFAIVTSNGLTLDHAGELKRTLVNHGGEARVIKANADATLDLNQFTHIISSTTDFSRYRDARDQMVPVVTPTWITQSLLRNKQTPLRPHNPDPKLIFSNVTITCGDIPTGDKNAIIGAVLAMGGMESSSLARTTTHVCALTADHPKSQEALTRFPKCKIVLPHWFDDCLKLGKRIDERPYLLPDPEIFRVNAEELMPFPVTEVLEGATSPRPESMPMPTDSPLRRLTVFKGKKVMLSEDLSLGNRLRGIIEDLIAGSKGSVTTSVHKADIYICQYREGRDYVFASRAEIDVGNLGWLYHLITHDEWTSPMRRLLHYPLPKNGIPGFQNYRITLSNYGGDARIYLENLVVAAGGEFTKSMKPENTHLITARKASEKCTAADEWNINMVNHLWLEESYARCEVQKLTDPRYTHFPPRTNLGEIIGQVQMDPKILKRRYFPRDPTPSPRDPVLQKRAVMHDKDRNVRSSDVSEPTEGDLTKKTKKLPTGSASERRINLDSGASLTTPVTNRQRIGGKENETPSSTNSRGAKDRAISMLHNLAPDIAEYEREMKRKGTVWGGDRAANRVEREQAMARSSSPVIKAALDATEEEEARSAKRQKIGKHKLVVSHKSLPPVDIRLLVTGYGGWLGNPHKEDLEKKKLRELGILVSTDALSCTHMAAPAMVRTQKFLCGLASGPTLLHTDFIDTCVKSTERPALNDFILKDAANEKKFKLKLEDIVSRAKANKRQLLRGIPIYCTPDNDPGPDTFKAIVESNGGTLLSYRGRGGATVKPTRPEDDEFGLESVFLLTSEKPSDRQLWPKFDEMAKTGNMLSRIVCSEWLLDAAMSQQLVWKDEYLVARS